MNGFANPKSTRNATRHGEGDDDGGQYDDDDGCAIEIETKMRPAANRNTSKRVGSQGPYPPNLKLTTLWANGIRSNSKADKSDDVAGNSKQPEVLLT